MQIDILSGLRQTARYFSFLFIISVLSVSCEKSINPAIPEENNEFNGEMNSLVATGTPYSWAKIMIDSVTAANNIYITSRDSVTWAGWGGFTSYRCETDCSGLLTNLLKQSYGYTNSFFSSWTGLSNPFASTYYNEIKARDRFSIISPVTKILRGDIIAIKYPAGVGSTGHIMVVADPPVLRTSTAPLISGTRQYEIPVMDCSQSGHGSTDTRYISSGVWNDGIGKGIFRVYVNSKGAIVGYTWSTYTNSIYYTQSERQLIVGRYIP